MISYPYINDLFKSILTLSKGIQGRFFISTRSGTEINTDDLGQVITDTLGKGTAKKYPLVMMLPPSQEGRVLYRRTTPNSGQRYRITLFFLETVGYLDGRIVKPNPTTGTSMQSVPDVWQDMTVCAKDFLRVLDAFGKLRTAHASYFQSTFYVTDTDALIVPIGGTVGVDRISGVQLSFSVFLDDSCVELEDYKLTDLIDFDLTPFIQ